jgi:predicted O-methyltransferase YrrM
MTSDDKIEWRGDDVLRIGDTEFSVAPAARRGSTPERFVVLKNREMVEAYISLTSSLRPRTIVELGIFDGGSTALLELLARPETLVAVELAGERVHALDEFLRRRRATGRVHPCYGISQADGETVLPIVHEHLGSTPLDLVIDDASHKLDLTRRSFEMLFPLLREGGVYVIEDWGWGHVPFPREVRGPSLAKLVLEVVLSLPFSDLVADVTVDKYWAMVRRGPAQPGTGGLHLSDHVSDRGRQLLATTDEDHRLR